MNLPRPLMQHGVAVLEKLFETSRTDAKVLMQLEHELKFREVPRARTLLVKVQKEMRESGQAGSSQPRPDPPRVDQPVVRAQPLRPESGSATRDARSVFDLETACRVLKVAANTKWEEIERSRRLAVQKSYPPRLAGADESEKARLVAEAKRANQAYEVLSAHRSALMWVPAPNNSALEQDLKKT